MKKLTISCCEDCPYYLFDWQESDPVYYGKSVCFHKDHALKCWSGPVILTVNTEKEIDENCPLEDAE